MLTLGGASGADVNVVIGGMDDDIISTGDSTDYVLGDNGILQWTAGVIDSIRSLFSGDGGNDMVTLGDGSKTVIAGVGNDTVDSGTAGIHRVIGDNGEIIYATGALRTVKSTADADGGQDTITLSGDVNQVIGGSDDDTIMVAAASSTDHVLGDNGVMLYTGPAGAEELINMQSLLGETGGDDSIILGSGDKVVIAGVGDDTVTTTLTSAGTRYVLGDEGEIGYDSNNVLEVAQSTSTDGGQDMLTLGGASGADVNVVIGGMDDDIISTGDSTDYVLGDNGILQWTAGVIDSITSTNTGIGGNDTVTLGDGFKVMSGGFGADSLNAGNGSNIVLGDNASILWNAGIIGNIATSESDIGGNDSIHLADGDKVSLAGLGDDEINTGAGNSILLGDNGIVSYTTGGLRQQVESELSTLGGVDTITILGGNNLVFGSVGDDLITTGDGDDVIFGDNGIADYIDGVADEYFTTDTTLDTSGNDTITSGAGNDLVFGGLGNELIFTDEGNDLVVGDLGIAVFNVTDSDPNTLDMVESISSDNGGEDEIHGGADDDMIIGGAAEDELYGDDGNDFISGDGGRVTFINGQLVISETTELFIGGDDILDGGDGNDSLFGAFGNDSFNAILTDDILAGEYAYLTQDEDNGEVISISYLAQGSLDLLANTTSGLYEQEEEDEIEVGNLFSPLISPELPEEIDEETGTIFTREAIHKYQRFTDKHSYEYVSVEQVPENTENLQTDEIIEPEDGEPDAQEDAEEQQEARSTGSDTGGITRIVHPGSNYRETLQNTGYSSVEVEVQPADTPDNSLSDMAFLAGLTGWKLTNGNRKGNIRIDQKGFNRLHHNQRNARHWDESRQCFRGDDQRMVVSQSDWEIASGKIRII
jgi:Ca2+-binding RTX toxin-like protein